MMLLVGRLANLPHVGPISNRLHVRPRAARKPSMRKALTAIILSLTLLTAAGGCTCGERIPVDFEDLCCILRYHGPACRRYPYSCPPCPYYDYQCRTWRDANCPCPAHGVSPQAGAASDSPDASESPDESDAAVD